MTMHRRDLLTSTLAGTAALAWAPDLQAADKRDWAAMARHDLKPVQPNLANVYATGGRTMASSDHPYATEAALWALERGGSAADAYMTAAIAQCVLEPTMTTLGGGFGMAFWQAETGQLALGGGSFAFPSGAPASEPYDERKSWTAWGAMVPGFVRGLEACHGAWGKLPWKDLFEPAIVFAEDGFVIDHLLWGYAKATRKMIGRFPGPGRDVWFRNGYMLGVGDTLRQPALAATLKALRDEGPDFFYTGPFARELAAEVQRRGGGITADDLKNFDQAYVSPAWKPGDEGGTPYRAFEVAPVSGPLFQLALRVYEAADLEAMGHPTESVEALHTQVRLAQELWIRGRDLTPENQAQFVSEDHAAEVLEAIRTGAPRPFQGFSAATCALAIVDAEGNVAAGTHSSSSEPFGTGINVGGVILNRATFIRKFTDMPKGFSTLLWLFRDGKPALAMATPSRSLMECLLQGAANIVEYGMPLAEAVSAPRFGHPHPGMTAIEIEGDFSEELLTALAARGHDLYRVSPKDINMGSIHGVRLSAEGAIEGVADPRRRGLAKGY